MNLNLSISAVPFPRTPLFTLTKGEIPTRPATLLIPTDFSVVVKNKVATRYKRSFISSISVGCHDQQLYQSKCKTDSATNTPLIYKLISTQKAKAIPTSARWLAHLFSPLSSQILRCFSCKQKEHVTFLLLPHKSAR